MDNDELIEKLQKKSKKILWQAIGAFCIAAILIFFLPVVITKCSWIGLADKPNEIGDTIGGIMGPAVALLGAILTFMAFWVQYEANIEQRRQFDQQLSVQDKQINIQNDQYHYEQIESRVFKLIDVYNSNVSQMIFKSRFSDTFHEGKNYFYTFYLHFTKLLKEIEEFDSKKAKTIDDKIYMEYKQNLMSKNSLVNIDNWISYELAYIILFFGVGKMGRENIKQIFSSKYMEDYLCNLLNYLSHKPADLNTNENSKSRWENISVISENFEKPNTNNFNRFYNGHQSRLGHYFRQLYMSMNYINTRPKLAYLDKWEYAKNFRSLFSNHEQLVIFLNSISILGRDWELNYIISKDNIDEENRKLITKYDLIKNIPMAYRNTYQIDKFYPNVEFEEEVTKITSYRDNLEKNVYK